MNSMTRPIMTEGATGLMPLKRKNTERLRRLADALDRDVLLLLSGCLKGVVAYSTDYLAAELQAAMPAIVIAGAEATITYGSRTGHAQGIAMNLANRRAAGAMRVLAADAYLRRDMPDERIPLVAISTHGDGDPPDTARCRRDFLNQRRLPRLESLRTAAGRH